MFVVIYLPYVDYELGFAGGQLITLTLQSSIGTHSRCPRNVGLAPTADVLLSRSEPTRWVKTRLSVAVPGEGKGSKIASAFALPTIEWHSHQKGFKNACAP